LPHTEERSESDLKQALTQSKQTLDSVVRNLPDGVVVTDPEGTILFVNPAAQDMFGYSAQKLLGRSFGYPVVSGETSEIEILHPRKLPIVVEMRVANVNWESKSGLLATLRDVSTRIKLTNDLKQRNKELDNFTSILSHEIMAPLRSMHQLSGWLLEDHAADLDDDATEDVEMVRKLSSRMQRMIEDLLCYSRVNSSGPITRQVKLDEVLQDALDSLEGDIFRTDAQVVTEPLPVIDGRVRQLVTLFRHIVSNAILYCESQPSIYIDATVTARTVTLRVRDNGIGVEEEYWDRVFIPFNHLQSRDSYEGTGVGLATCRKIVELHSGSIKLESEPGKGSLVSVTLPVEQP